MRKILLTGGRGQIGWELQRTLAPFGEIVVVNRQEMDLADPDSIRTRIREVEPQLIVNAAGYTAVDKAESEPELAMAVNGVAPGIIGEEAKKLGATVVHYSTDYVFDGTKTAPYSEEDAPNPLNVYGRTKLAGERALAAVGVPNLILRTSWVYGARGRNFFLTILRLAGEKKELKVVIDQQGSPTWCRMVAEVTSHMLAQHYSLKARAGESMTDFSGLYHVTSSGMTTWHGFAGKILENDIGRKMRSMPELISVSSDDYPLPAKRPQNSCLSNDKLARAYGLKLPSWEKSLTMCFDELAESPVNNNL